MERLASPLPSAAAVAAPFGAGVQMPSPVRSAPKVRVALLTNEIAPYSVPYYQSLAETPGWDFKVFTCVDREVGRLWNVEHKVPFAMRRCFSLSYIRRMRHPDPNGFEDTRQIHLPLGLLWDLWKFRPDVILSGEMGARTILALLYARVCQRKLVIGFEGTPHTERNITRSQQWTRRIIRDHAHAYVVIGRQGREYIESFGVPSERVFEIGQQIDTNWFSSDLTSQQCNALRKELGIQGFYCLFCGSLTPRKGCDQLLDAWELFSRQPGVNATLLLAGDGCLRSHLEQRVAAAKLTNVRFLSHVPRDRLRAFYQAADVFVFPTLEDCWALVVNEAMASGLPVINSVYAGSAELIVEGKTGWVADPFNAAELAGKLRLAWEARDRRHLMREAVRQTIANMSIPSVADRVRRVVEHVRRTDF